MMTIAMRKKIREQELQDIKDKLWTNLPNLTKRQIRRHRIPYHEALILELQEDGYIESAEYIKALIEYQDQFRQEAGPESLIWFKPELKLKQNMIDRLYEGLRNAETGIQNNQISEECDNLLKLGVFYSNQTDGWWWLAEQIFLECVNCVKNYSDDGGRRHATSRYIFGRFLLNQLNKPDEAKDHLRICRDISIGQSWCPKNILGIPQDTLFIECCTLLYKALLILAKELSCTDLTKAGKMISIAQKHAVDANDLEGQAECLYQYGICDLLTNNAIAALLKLNRALIINFSIKNDIGIFNTRLQIALAHTKSKNMTEASYHLKQLLDYSEKKKNLCHIAKAHRYIGEFYLKNAQSHEATVHLLKAVDIFHELGDYDNREHAKNLAAISTGRLFALKYRELLQDCNKPDKEGEKNLMKMIYWKDMREIFWSESDIEIDKRLYIERIPKIGDIVFNDDVEEEEKITETKIEEDEIRSAILEESSFVTNQSTTTDASKLGDNAVIIELSEY